LWHLRLLTLTKYHLEQTCGQLELSVMCCKYSFQ
jgi:hypothetical protein